MHIGNTTVLYTKKMVKMANFMICGSRVYNTKKKTILLADYTSCWLDEVNATLGKPK